MKILGVLGAVLALLIVGVVAAGWCVLRASGARSREQYAASLAKVPDEFLADQELARTYPVLAPARHEQDAGSYLNARIGWDIDPAQLAALNEALRGALAMREAVGPGDGEPIHWVSLDGDFASACRLSLVRRAIAHARDGDVERYGGPCVSADSAVRLLCRVLEALPGGRAVERAVGKEVLTQMVFANLHPDSWYAPGAGGSSR